MKKILLSLFAIFMLIGLMSLSASAASEADLSYTVADGKVTITGCVESASGELVIPDTIEGYPVTVIGTQAFYDCTALEKVTLPDSIVVIEMSAFYGCSSLTEIIIPDGVMSILPGAFRNCTVLTEITIPDSVQALGAGVFSGCTSLKKVTLPDGITEITARLFEKCTNLAQVTIPDSVIYLRGYAFYGCTALTEIDIGDGVTTIGAYAFTDTAYYNDSNNWQDGVLYCGEYLLGSISREVPATYTIKEGTRAVADSAFTRCGNLTEVIIPDSVIAISDSMFSYCSNLAKITIPDSVTSIGGYSFLNCSALTEIVILDSVTSIGHNAFYGCTNLSKITIGNGITSIGNYVFYNTAYYNDSNNWENGVLYCGNCLLVVNKDEVAGTFAIKEGTKVIAHGVFSSCEQLTEITLPDGITSIGEAAFEGCTSLTEIVIPDGVTSIGNYAFYNCKNLTEIVIPDGVTSIGGYTFYYCKSLTEITIPASVTTIENSAFYYCNALTTVRFEGNLEQWEALTIASGNDSITNAPHILITEEEIPATCGEAGREAGEYCIKCEAFEIGGTEIPATGNHIGGEATCIAPAVCGVCDNPYGGVNDANHKTTEVRGAYEATYDAPGYTGDTYCTDCGTLIEAGEEIAQLVKPAEPDDTTEEKDIFHWLIELIRTIVEFLMNAFDI